VDNSELANMAAGTVKGRARGSGTGAPTDLTGAQLGAIWRIGNQVGDATTTGSVATYTVAEGTNQVTFNSVSPIIHGISVPVEIGQFLIIQHIGSGSTTFVHESGTAGAAGQRLRLGPYGSNVTGLVLGQNQAATFTYDNRWVYLGTSAISADNVSPIRAARAIPFTVYVPCPSGGTAGTADDVTVWNADAPALRILDATLRVSTAVALSSAALRTASGGGGSVVLPDPVTPTQTFLTSATGPFDDVAVATATVASGGSLFLRRSDRSVVGELILTCIRT
jgi:hypothetical protein